mmetsp:Transcript_130439/g.260263  ORF Transcript_130439/g.260263 Transcript_130439/m.260263 type:complete len:122 (-) Transcript_130439:138-503(-)
MFVGQLKAHAAVEQLHIASWRASACRVVVGTRSSQHVHGAAAIAQGYGKQGCNVRFLRWCHKGLGEKKGCKAGRLLMEHFSNVVAAIAGVEQEMGKRYDWSAADGETRNFNALQKLIALGS